MKILYLGILMTLLLGCSSDRSTATENNGENNFNCNANNGLYPEAFLNISSLEDVETFLENPYKEFYELRVSNLDNLSFLSCVEKVECLYISNCGTSDLSSLSNLLEVSNLFISNMPSLINLNGLNNLSSVNYLEIRNNSSLINFVGLNGVGWIEYMSVTDNESLMNLEGLDNLNTLGVLKIEDNSSIQNLEGLNNVETVNFDGSFTNCNGTPIGLRWEISNNSNLSSISAINNISGDLSNYYLEINSCQNLTDLGSFDNLLKLGNFWISGCPITSLNCFPSLTETGYLTVWDCDNLEYMNFPALQKLSYLNIKENNLLNNISFNSLVEISGGGNGDFSAKIEGNDSLSTLAGLDNLEYNEKIIWINIFYQDFENPLLNVCALRKLYLNQIMNGVNENQIHFNTMCWGNAGFPYSNISDFDSICDCN
ncbi:hypothetical protein AB9K26_00665 [Psychroserpens sp. XS_ASV72]